MKISTLKAVVTAVLILALIGGGVATASVIEKKSEKAPEGAGTTTYYTVREEEALEEVPNYDAPDARETVHINGKDYYPRENISTLLVIGVDDMEVEQSDTARNGALADFLVLAILDDEAKTCTLLQINRNTMADVFVLNEAGNYVGTLTQQITYAHTYGDGLEESCENTVNTVSSFLYGAPIDNYLALAMGGIVPLNDAVGGVTVTVEDDFTGVDDTLVKGETVTLHGEHAMNFVRSRMNMTDDPTNEARMRRQAAYMTALVDAVKAKEEADNAFIFELFTAVADYLVTDCELDELGTYSANLADYTLDRIVTPEGRIEQGEYAEFYPDEAKLQQLVTDLFYVPAEA